MTCFRVLWERLTQNALGQSPGKLEVAFFESVYRMTYITGLSLAPHQTVPYQIYSYIIKVSIVLFVCSEIWYLMGVSFSLDVVIESINVTVIHIIVMYRYEVMVKNKHVYNKLAKAMDSPLFDISTPGRKKIIQHWLHYNNKYLNILIVLAVGTLSIWYFQPLMDDIEFNFMTTVRLPFDHKTPLRYPIAYSAVLLVFHYISVFVVVNDLLMQTFLIHLNCQFDILSDCFMHVFVDCKKDFIGHDENTLLTNKKFREKILQRLGYLVDQHKNILNNAMELKNILSKPMLGQLGASSVLICLAGYQVTRMVTVNTAKFMMSVLYLSYNLFNFYVICRWCDEIKIQSQDIQRAIYFSGWENGMAVIPGVRSRLLLVVARASRPVVLTAGGLYDVSLASYTTLVKTSYSALTVLLRMRQR